MACAAVPPLANHARHVVRPPHRSDGRIVVGQPGEPLGPWSGRGRQRLSLPDRCQQRCQLAEDVNDVDIGAIEPAERPSDLVGARGCERLVADHDLAMLGSSGVADRRLPHSGSRGSGHMDAVSEESHAAVGQPSFQQVRSGGRRADEEVIAAAPAMVREQVPCPPTDLIDRRPGAPKRGSHPALRNRYGCSGRRARPPAVAPLSVGDASGKIFDHVERGVEHAPIVRQVEVGDEPSRVDVEVFDLPYNLAPARRHELLAPRSSGD